MVASRENFPLLAELLADQQRLDTPVARASALHDQGTARAHAELIPLTKPAPGEQYAFEVDLDACSGCKSCVAACHALNGLDENETWRDVGLLVGTDARHPFTQTVTTACHHCEDPACLNGCPVLAYEKDPLTGIVRHLDDQCIGCSYCILKCPYDVPKFSSRLGIVRKCDMCHSRLAAGEAPACAQSCPTQAIRIVTVVKNRIPDTGDRKPGEFLPAAPDPAYTQPTTRYVSRRPLPTALAAADAGALRVQPSHGPLAVMLTLLPLAIGLGAAGATMGSRPLLIASLAIGALGLAASVFHLGQPLRAWRIFLGWRTSWLSREAMFFGAWFGLAGLAVAQPELAILAAALGGVALFCSAMIYIDTRRRFWRASQTLPRFYGTAVIAALAALAPLASAVLLGLKLAIETRTWFDHSVSGRLQRQPLRPLSLARDLSGISAIVLFAIGATWTGLVVFAIGELLERLLFFRAVDAPKMPGMPVA